MGEMMWKALLLLVCVLGSIETISGEGYPPICPKNEAYYNCSGGCIPRRCSEIGFPLNCNKKCTPGCVCKASYVRADNGTCIPIPDCPSCGGDKNAQQGCGNNCGHTCSDYNKPKKPCPPGCIFNGCNCRKGFVYDNNVKSCIKPEECKYSPCTNGGCVAKNCSQIGKPVPCVTLNPVLYKRMCMCDRISESIKPNCVPKDLCAAKCDKPNEVYDVCPVPCPPKRCNVDERVIDCAPPPKPGDPECEPGCRCAEKYYRNATGTCVLKNNCEKPLNCVGPNEVYDACPAICPPQECGVNPAVILCMRNPEYGDLACRPSCVCRDGYVRNDAKKCIPKDKCPKCDGLNEYWEKCIPGCSNQTCDTINQTYFCPYQKGCKSGCRCSPGFYRNGSNVCVPEDECPPICKVNEEYSPCINGGCGPKNCSQVGQPNICIDPVSCIKGCVCVKGYLRAANGTCVPTDKCPPPDCPKGEVWNKCPTVKCDGDWCPKTRDSPQTCPVGIVCDKPRCVCGYNMKRDWKTGKCIPIPDCPPFKCACNEEYLACSPSCPGDECTGNDKRVCPKIGIIANCRPQCRCTKGHCRKNDGKCVLACKCAADSPADKH